MKTSTFKSLLLALFAVIAVDASAQAWLEDPKYGTSPEEREQNVITLNFFNDTYDQQDYDAAVGHLQKLYAKAPKASQNLYIKGAQIYRTKIAKATSVADKNLNIDSLMYVYDLRAEHFGEHPTRGRGYILALKARDYQTYKPMDRDNVILFFQQALEAQGEEVDIAFVNVYFKELTDDYKADNIEADYLMGEYERLAKYFDEDPTPEKVEAKITFDALFIASGAANCENLETLFKAKLEAAPDDEELISKAVSFMNNAKCDSDFQLEVTEKYYAIKPTSEMAMALANIFGAKGNNEKALHYLNESIETETDPIKKSNLAVQIAATELSSNNAQTAAKFSKDAIEINPENGYAYIILGQAYAVGSNSCAAGFDRQCVFWLVYDTLLKAKNLLAEDDPQQASISQNMATYRAGFPSKEECFFRGLDNGASIAVRCGWVVGSTTVREGN